MNRKTGYTERFSAPSAFHKVAAFAAALMAACAGEEASAPAGTRHVTQGGHQDIANFRRIVADGEVPSPDVLDEAGFFAEHAMPLPSAECGDAICFHPMLAVAPRFDGSNWTMAFIGINAQDVPPSNRPRHTVIALERSRAAVFGSGQHRALISFLDELDPRDRVTVIDFGETTRVRARFAPPNDTSLRQWLEGEWYWGEQEGHNVFGALAEGARAARETPEGYDVRMLTLMSGTGLGRLGVEERVLGLADDLARDGVGWSYVGVGNGYDAGLADRIAELASATVARAESADELESILSRDALLSLVPVANNVTMRVEVPPAYRIGHVYGAHRIEREPGAVTFELPALFLGRVQGEASGGNRRGGGGGFFVELIGEGEGAPNQEAFSLHTRFERASRAVARTQRVVNSLAPGANPDTMWPAFSSPDHGEIFMMLNMYLALRATTRFLHEGDCARSLGVVDMFAPSVEQWLALEPSEDIDEDFALLMSLRQNVDRACQVQPERPRAFSGGCFAL